MGFNDVFSLVAFFIFLRETLEASVIIAVLLQCMNRTFPRLKRQVWFGAFTGIGVSILAGGVFAVVYYVAKSKLFQGTGKFIFQGCISYLACILITYLGFAMLRFANMERKVARKLDTAAQKAIAANESAGSRRHGWSVFILAFTAVLREGIESIVFLAGVGSNTSFKAIPLACAAGLIVGLAVGAVVYWSGHSIKDLKIFFGISTFVLFFIAAGQVSLGTQLLSVAGAFGKYAAWTDELTWQYRPMADYSHCCSDDPVHGNQFFVLARAVFGYTARPTPVVIMCYCAYWAAVIAALVWKWHNGSLFDADYKRNRTHLKLSRTVASKQRQLARAEKQLAKAEAAGDAAKAAECSSKIATLQQELRDTEVELEAEQQRLDEDDRRTAALLGTGGPQEGGEVAKDVELGSGSSSDEGRSSEDSADCVAKLGSASDVKVLAQEQQGAGKGSSRWSMFKK